MELERHSRHENTRKVYNRKMKSLTVLRIIVALDGKEQAANAIKPLYWVNGSIGFGPQKENDFQEGNG